MQPTLAWVILLASAANLAGGILLFFRKNWPQESLFKMIGLGAGLLIALTILDLLPHSVGEFGNKYMPFVLIGFILLFITERMGQNRGSGLDEKGMMGVFLGFMLHAFFEGLSLAASFYKEASFGLPVLTALVLHKIPDGVAIASLTMAVTGKRLTAFLGSLLLGVATLAGALFMRIANMYVLPQWSNAGIAIATGVFLYVSASHLVPMIHKSEHPRISLYFCAAVLFYLFISLFFHTHHQHAA